MHERIDVETLLRLLDVGEEAMLAAAHTLFGRDLEKAGIQFPLFQDIGLLDAVEIARIDDLGRVKDAAQETELVEHGLLAAKIKGKASQWLGTSAVDHQTAGEHARKVIDQTIKQDRLLLRLAAKFESQV